MAKQGQTFSLVSARRRSCVRRRCGLLAGRFMGWKPCDWLAGRTRCIVPPPSYGNHFSMIYTLFRPKQITPRDVGGRANVIFFAIIASYRCFLASFLHGNRPHTKCRVSLVFFMRRRVIYPVVLRAPWRRGSFIEQFRAHCAPCLCLFLPHLRRLSLAKIIARRLPVCCICKLFSAGTQVWAH